MTGFWQVCFRPLAAASAIAAGVVAASISTPLLAALLSVVLVFTAYLWRSGSAMVPFLLLVAAMQGGNMLRVSMGDAPISTLMPILGGWAVLAVFIWQEPKQLRASAVGAGKLLVPALEALGLIIVVTAVAQVWRADGETLSLQEVLTVVQLGVLVVLSMHLLHNPRRVLLVGYVITALGVILSILALLTQVGVTLPVFAVMNYGEYGRASGLVGDPNYFSFQLLLALAFAANIGLASKTTRSRLWAWPAFIVILAGIISTYSGGALVGVAAVLVGTILLQLRVSAKRAVVAFVVIGLATVVVGLLAPSNYGEAIQEKYSSITQGSFEDIGTGRGAAWKAAARAMLSNPVLGVGLGGDRVMREIADHYGSMTVHLKAAHNVYLGMGVGTGFFGLAAFLVLLASCFSLLWGVQARLARAGSAEGLLASSSLFTAMLVVATQGLTLSLEYEKFVWLLIGACLAARYWSEKTGPVHDGGQRSELSTVRVEA